MGILAYPNLSPPHAAWLVGNESLFLCRCHVHVMDFLFGLRLHTGRHPVENACGLMDSASLLFGLRVDLSEYRPEAKASVVHGDSRPPEIKPRTNPLGHRREELTYCYVSLCSSSHDKPTPRITPRLFRSYQTRFHYCMKSYQVQHKCCRFLVEILWPPDS